MEFIINTDIVSELPQKIDFNFEAQKAWLEERLAYYNGLVVTQETIKDAKADRAKLNKLREAMETRRKEVKREWLRPYMEFEAKVKELVALVDKPVSAIDDQLAGYEEQRKAEKMEQVVELYGETVPDTIKEIIPLEKIFDKRWLNAGTALKKIAEDISTIVNRVHTDMLAMEAVEPEHKAAVRAKYMETLDLGSALRHMADLEAAAAAFEAGEAEVGRAEKPAQEASVETLVANPAPEEKLYCLRHQYCLTIAQANALKQFLAANNIKYERI